jgi:hypothetical protein
LYSSTNSYFPTVLWFQGRYITSFTTTLCAAATAGALAAIAAANITARIHASMRKARIVPGSPSHDQSRSGYRRSALFHGSLLDLTQGSGNAERLDFGDLRSVFRRRDASLISHERLSFGQKRLLAFLYYLEANPSVVVADELVDGLHHRWIEKCIEADRERMVWSNMTAYDAERFFEAYQVGIQHVSEILRTKGLW